MGQIIQTTDIEAMVLGCIMLDPELLDDVVAQIQVSDFHDLRHRNIFELMISLSERGEAIDAISLRVEAIERLGNAEKIGGDSYLSGLMNSVPSALHISFALPKLKQRSELRRMEMAAHGLLHTLSAEEADDDKIEKCGATLAGLLDQQGGAERSIKDIAKAVMQQIESAHSHKGECTGVASGFRALDNKTTGMHGGELVILAARPGMGKTSLAMGIAEHLSVDGDTPVGVLSLEMKADALILRTFAGRSGIDSRDLRAGNLYKPDFPKLQSSLLDISNSHLHIDDAHGISIVEAGARVRRMVNKSGCKLIIVDYLQLMSAKADNRTQEVSKISSGLKTLANQCNVPILCLSQLNRSVETHDRPPRLSDLKESGSIEQDADQVWFLYRDNPNDTITRLIVAKNRSGPTGEIDLEFEAKFTRYVSPRPPAQPQTQRPVHPDFEPANA